MLDLALATNTAEAAASNFGIPTDATWYSVLKDLGGAGALVAFFAAIIAGLVAFITVRMQLKASEQSREQDRSAASTLIAAALTVFEFDLNHAQNTFDPGGSDERFLQTVIEPERAAFLRDRIKPPLFEPLLPYAARLGEDDASEFLFVYSISLRVREHQGPITYGELRDRVVALRQRSRDLRQRLEIASGA